MTTHKNALNPDCLRMHPAVYVPMVPPPPLQPPLWPPLPPPFSPSCQKVPSSSHGGRGDSVRSQDGLCDFCTLFQNRCVVALKIKRNVSSKSLKPFDYRKLWTVFSLWLCVPPWLLLLIPECEVANIRSKSNLDLRFLVKTPFH